jgi:nitroreductase
MRKQTPAQAWQLRYGTEAPGDLPELGDLLGHRSVREFDSREIPESIVRGLVAAAQSAATSSNLQLWTIVSVQELETREQITKLCGDQKQIRECGWFLVFLADHYRLRQAAAEVGEKCEGLDYNEFYTMAVIDAALAAERLVCAAEHVGLGICYIGAVRNSPEAMQELLDLPEGTVGLFGICLGWPAETCVAEIKPRLRQDTVWHREKYNQIARCDEYNLRMKEFYEAQKMKGDVTWAMRSGRRVNGTHMTGREVLKAYLAKQGFDKR